MSAKQPPDATRTGRLRKYHSNFYYVEADGILYECFLRGIIKKEGTEPMVGDFVELDSIQPSSQTARINRVLERKNSLSRPKLANVDQVFVVYSLKEPAFDPHQMDRYLTHVELAGLKPILCISKSDLASSPADLEAIQSLYRDQLGYTVIFTALKNPESLALVRSHALRQISVLAGPSGSGKSSLLNALNPDLQLRIGEISEKISRGQHTTRHVELLSLFESDSSTLIADTPGFSNLKFNYVMPERLQEVFKEFAALKGQCAFSDCLHVDEEGCVIRASEPIRNGTRYQSYLSLLTEARLFKESSTVTSQKEAFGYKQLDRKGKEALRILRLKEKNRDASRRTVRQQVSQLDHESEQTDLETLVDE